MSSHWSKERGLTTGNTEMHSCGASSPPGTSRRQGRASGVQATGAKRFRDIAFIVVSAPPPAEQVIHLKDVAPKPESSWRGRLSRTPMCLEEKVVASVQARSAREQGVGVAGGGVVCSPWISVALPHATPSPQLNPAFPPSGKRKLGHMPGGDGQVRLDDHQTHGRDAGLGDPARPSRVRRGLPNFRPVL